MIKQTVNAIIDLYSKADSRIDLKLRPPASLGDIQRLEDYFGFRLDEDLVSLLRVFDGQEVRDEDCFPFFPNLIHNKIGIISQGWITSVDEMIYQNENLKEQFQEVLSCGDFRVIGPAKFHNEEVYFTLTGNADSLAIDMFPSEGGKSGQVVCINTQPNEIVVVKWTLSDLLQEVKLGLESGSIRGNSSEFFEGSIRIVGE